jgi:hypothetical protein
MLRDRRFSIPHAGIADVSPHDLPVFSARFLYPFLHEKIPEGVPIVLRDILLR